MEKNKIIENIKNRFGYDKLTSMQLQVADSHSDSLVLLAPTGSGKTVAFTINMLSGLSQAGKGVQAVVIAPSRELVLQIYEVIRPVASGYKTVAFYGGHSMQDEIKSLSVVPDIIIGTPGRLLDHIERGNVDLSKVNTLVIDEYDKALELGFADEMKKCVKAMNHPSRIILTSATKLNDLPAYLNMSEVEEIVAKNVENPRGRIQTVHVESPSIDKLDILVDLLRSIDDGKVIVFVNHRESAERVWRYLLNSGLPVGLYHGGLDQRQREQAIDLLNNGTTPILISTDLGSRGLDIDNVQSVIHYHMPLSAESMTHRNGRTARMGASGTVYYITSEGDDIPSYVEWDRDYVPTANSANPIKSHVATLYFNAGKREKVSRGDIVGFLIANTGLTADEIGKIVVKDHNSLAGIPVEKVDDVLQKTENTPLKGKKIRISILSGGEEPKEAKPVIPRSGSPIGKRKEDIPATSHKNIGRKAPSRDERSGSASYRKDKDWREIVRRMEDYPRSRKNDKYGRGKK